MSRDWQIDRVPPFIVNEGDTLRLTRDGEELLFIVESIDPKTCALTLRPA